MTAGVEWSRELAHTWPLLEVEGPTSIASAPLPILAGAVDVRIGIDGTDARHLLVPVGDEDVSVPDDEGAVTMQLRTYTFQAAPRRYVDVVCSRPDLVDVFDDVLVDILGQIAVASAPANTTVEAVARWRTLLASRRSRRLTLVEQMSLFAELSVLELVAAGSTPEAAWWRGPRREPHDIVTPGRAIEVKAVGDSSTAVTIHGIEQLEPPGRPLALVVAEIDEDPSGRSLPELVDAVLARVDDKGEMVYLLTSAGYERADAERYQERFAMNEIGHVEVADGFPRIIESSFAAGGLPRGLSGVEYRLSLDVVEPLLTPGDGPFRSWVVG